MVREDMVREDMDGKDTGFDYYEDKDLNEVKNV